MPRLSFSKLISVCGVAFVLFSGSWALAQAVEDGVIDTIRGLQSISAPDQGRIERWLTAKVEGLKSQAAAVGEDGYAALYAGFRGSFGGSSNSDAFDAVLAAKLAAIAAVEVSHDDLSPLMAFALPRALVELNRIETLPGLLAGLSAPVASARFLSARGLARLRPAIAATDSQLPGVIAALGEAGSKETEPVVLSGIYLALAYPNHAGDVFAAFISIFDQRLAFRRGPAEFADGGEVEAFEYFRGSSVSSQLNAQQQADLVRRLAVFLRLDAERYNDPRLAPPERAGSVDRAYGERDALERMLIANESILSTLSKKQSKPIGRELGGGGWSRRQAVLSGAYAWVGDPTTSGSGILSEAPWNVPVGAP